MKEKAGDIIFLTKRTVKKPLYRWFISNSIAVLTKFKGQKTKDVKVHSAIVFKATIDDETNLYVRDMEAEGNVPILLKEYKKIFRDRLEIVPMPKINNAKVIAQFNREALSRHVKYDYLNTFVWQVLRALGHKWIGWNTPYKRMCAEDVQRMYNMLNPIFNTPEQTNPNELYKFIKA